MTNPADGRIILTIPFTYRADVVLAGKRNPTTLTIRDSVDVVVPLLAGDDAPLVARMKSPDHTTGNVPIELRHHDDRLWRGVVHATEGGAGPLTLETYKELLSLFREVDAPTIWEPRTAWELRDALGAIPPNRRSVASTTRDEELARILRRTADTVFIDGILYRPSDEPVYACWRDRSVVHVASGMLDTLRQRFGERRLWRVTDWDEMLETMAGGPDEARLAELESSRVDVHRPDLLKWDGELDRFLGHARPYVEQFRREIADKPVPFMAAWGTMRDVCAAAPDTDAGANAIADAICAFMAVHDPQSEERSTIKAALERWNTRGRGYGSDAMALDSLAAPGMAP